MADKKVNMRVRSDKLLEVYAGLPTGVPLHTSDVARKVRIGTNTTKNACLVLEKLGLVELARFGQHRQSFIVTRRVRVTE